MGLEEIKKQIMLLREAIINLDPQERLEAIEFLNESMCHLRLKPSSYEDECSAEVLNLTKKEYFPLDNPYDCNDQYSNFRMSSYFGPQDFSAIASDKDYYKDVSSEDNFGISTNVFNNWPMNSDDFNEASNPVNLVLPQKEKTSPSLKKSRRKQMFTRKSVRRLNEKSKTNSAPSSVDKKETKTLKCLGCNILLSNTELINHAKSHGPISLSCRLCRSTFGNLVNFYRHEEEKKCRVKAGFVCPECGDKFKFESHYMKHLYGHRDNNCKHCPEKFSSRAQCRDHMKKIHPEIKIERELIPCKFCPMSFPRHHRLYNHYRLHHSKGKFVCTSCGLFLPTKEKHKEHMLEHENEKKWKCSICNKKFYSVNILTNHMKIHNSGIYKCLTCNVTVASKVELMGHKKNKHEVRGLEPKFKCDECNKMFSKKSILERHLSIHSKKNCFSCLHCVKTFSTLDGLVKHQKRKTHFNKAHVVVPESKYEKLYEDQLVCESCGKQYKTYTQLVYHLRTHKTIYSCEKCCKTFTMKVNLRRHLKLHESKKVAVCELCGDLFSRVGSLKEHMVIKHSDAKPMKCLTCSKCFKRKSELTRHMRIHAMARPYVCFCGRDYKQAAHLRSHQKSIHGKTSVQGLINEVAAEAEKRRSIDESQALGSLPHDLLDRDRIKNYGVYENTDTGTLLALENFDDQGYRLPDSFKVSYVEEDYNKPLGYIDLQFGAPPAVSPAVDLSMVAISDVVCRDMDTGLIKTEAKSDALQPEPSSAIQLVNLSEHTVQEYLLNLP